MSEHFEGLAPQAEELAAARLPVTPARIGLARTGTSIATSEQLRFQLDHALARDAVHTKLDTAGILHGLRELGFAATALRSAVPAGAGERQTYLRRPDLGRRLDAESIQALRTQAAAETDAPDVVICIADGLSSLAVERNALPLMQALRVHIEEAAVRVGPVCVVSQGRVAVGDEIAELLGAPLVVMLIGERPGLSAADSLGAYITWQPRVGRTDAERNCISNIRGEGLSPADAAARIVEQIDAAWRLGGTGVAQQPKALPGA